MAQFSCARAHCPGQRDRLDASLDCHPLAMNCPLPQVRGVRQLGHHFVEGCKGQKLESGPGNPPPPDHTPPGTQMQGPTCTGSHLETQCVSEGSSVSLGHMSHLSRYMSGIGGAQVPCVLPFQVTGSDPTVHTMPQKPEQDGKTDQQDPGTQRKTIAHTVPDSEYAHLRCH